MRLRDDDDKFGYAVIAVQGPGYQNCDDHCALTVAKELVGSWNLGYCKYEKSKINTLFKFRLKNKIKTFYYYIKCAFFFVF